MTESRKTPPSPQGSADDAPLPGVTNGLNGNGIGKAGAVKPNQPEPNSFRDVLDLSKLQFGQKLIGWCISLILLLTIIGHFSDGDGTILSSTIETLKLVTTTALGFVFAKSMADDEEKKN